MFKAARPSPILVTAQVCAWVLPCSRLLDFSPKFEGTRQSVSARSILDPRISLRQVWFCYCFPWSASRSSRPSYLAPPVLRSIWFTAFLVVRLWFTISWRFVQESNLVLEPSDLRLWAFFRFLSNSFCGFLLTPSVRWNVYEAEIYLVDLFLVAEDLAMASLTSLELLLWFKILNVVLRTSSLPVASWFWPS
jgi:hypothetical protein